MPHRHGEQEHRPFAIERSDALQEGAVALCVGSELGRGPRRQLAESLQLRELLLEIAFESFRGDPDSLILGR